MPADHVADVVALLGIDRHDVVQAAGLGSTSLSVGNARRLFQIVRRQEAEQAAAQVDAPPRRLRRRNGSRPNAPCAHRRPPSASAVISSPVTCLMTCGPVMNIWALTRLDDEVGQGRGIRCAAGTGSADQRDLRHGAGQQDVGVEDLAVAGQRVDPFLDASAAGVVDEDEGAAGLQRPVHHVGDFQRVHFAGRAAQGR